MDSTREDSQVSNLYPVILGSPETTLAIDTDSENSECDWNREVDVIRNNPHTSTMNVENSNDVVIGPLTQFHGPVTIYQNVTSDNQGSQENSTSESSTDMTFKEPAKALTPDINLSEKRHATSTSKLLTPSYKRLTTYIILIFAVLVSIIVTIIVTLSTPEDYVYDKDNEITKENSSLLGPHKMYSRTEWGAKEPTSTRNLTHPTEYVIISHTAGGMCQNFVGCATALQSIQIDHMTNLKSPDIGYNFLIGGDANIYIGRSWDFVNFHRNNNIGISFMGNFGQYNLTKGMISALEHLLALGVKMKKLNLKYKLVCHSQTGATESPGENACREISKFPNYVAGPVQI